ncbi:MAG: thiamine phosphate synthase [Acidobacteriia bacterium]|nr:thiamine phosphate synthase [Terriglobia bacterium]
MSRVRRPVFCYITDRHQLPVASFPALISNMRRVLSWGVDFIQLREKDLPDRELLKLTKNAVALACGTQCRILVNGRPDVALAGGAHGVHLPSAGIRASDLRPHLPIGFVLGVSTHSLREARRAAVDGADYILLGPIFRTASKIGYGNPLGLNHFSRICSALSIPVFGLGGIGPDRIGRVLKAGASGIAGISLFQQNLHLLSRSSNNWRTQRLSERNEPTWTR